LERQLGLDRPILEQYLYWLVGNDWRQVDRDGDGLDADDPRGKRKGVLRGDFGTSLVTRQPALEIIWDRLPNTLLLMGTAQIVTVTLGLIIGIVAATRQYSLFDNLVTGFAFITYSMPIFFIAIMLIYIFSINAPRIGLPALPFIGMYDPIKGRTTPQVLQHMILPVASLSLIAIANYSRYIRASMLEVLNSDYIRTARAKGLSEALILNRHALRNALLPLVTLIGIDLPLLLAGAVVTEQIFAWPGMGQLFINSLNRTDIPVLMGILMLVSTAVVLFQLLTDLIYLLLDPRIRLA
jgi:peptide/nickel transport system permease protein